MKKNLMLGTIKLVPALNPVTEQGGGSDINGATIDRNGFLTTVVGAGVGAVSGTPDSFKLEVRLQHGEKSDASDMADVTGYTLTNLTAVNTNTHKAFDLTGLKRYIRAVYKFTFVNGTSPKGYITGAVALGDAEAEPVS